MNNSIEHGTQGDLAEQYINSLSSANPMPIKIGQSNCPNHQDIERQEEEYKKSVMIILWYKGNTEPLRLQQMIPTFPYFQLSTLTSLVLELGLSSNSYLDTYNPMTEQWDQHLISTVRMIDTQQRLLYRVRKSLLEGLKEEDCIGLYEEIQLQRQCNKYLNEASSILSRQRDSMPKSNQKRLAVDKAENAPLPKVHVPSNYYLNQHQLLHRHNDHGSLTHEPLSPSTSQPNTQSIPTPPSSASSNIPTDDFAYPSPSIYNNNNTTASIPPSSSAVASSSSLDIPIIYPPHPPLKRWPNDYTVAEISSGFSSMDALVSQSANGVTMTHKVAFERVFGSRYVKSTVCRHRGVWKKAHPNVRAQYEAMGNDERAYWGEFVRHVEGRPPSLRLGSATQGMASPSTSGMARTGVTADEDDGGRVDDQQVIDALQNQGPASALQNINVYDTSLNAIGSNTHG